MKISTQQNNVTEVMCKTETRVLSSAEKRTAKRTASRGATRIWDRL